jgi:phage repressor protein C with HTH and peptisase S24 domain
MIDIGLKIKNLRSEKNLSQTQLASILGVSSRSIASYEAGTTPHAETLIKLAALLNISLDELFGYSPKRIADVNSLPIVSSGAIDQLKPIKDEKSSAVLFVNTVANAGTASATDFTKGTPFLLPGNKKEGLVMLDVKGDSMLPTIVDGDRVICEQITDPLSVAYQGITVVVGRDGSVLIKMLTLDNDSYILTSLNSMYPVARFAKEDVVQLWRPVLLLTSRLFS